MPSFVLFAAVAHADVAMCSQIYVSQTMPGPMQEGVPIDAVLSLNFDGGNCSPPSGFAVELDDADGNVVASDSFPWGTQVVPFMYELEHPDLEPNAAYILRISSLDGWGELTEVAFTTGAERVVGIDANPNVEIGSAVDTRDYSAQLTVYATPAPDPDGMSWLEVRNSLGVVQWRATAASVAGGSGAIFVSTPFDSGFDTEACVQVVQIDGRGAEHEADACMVPVRESAQPGGCDTGGRIAPFASLLAFLLPLLRRKP